MPKKKQDSVKQSGVEDMFGDLIDVLFAWLVVNEDWFETGLADAKMVFWGDREGLEPIGREDDAVSIFKEWLALDYSINGCEGVPYAKRRNILSVFLDEFGKDLDPESLAFATSVSASSPSLYRVVSVDSAGNVTLDDTFSEERIEVTNPNLNLNRAIVPELSFLSRFAKDASGAYVRIGAQTFFLSPEEANDLLFLVKGTCAMAAMEMDETLDIAPFLKWNSYIYYREVRSWQRRRRAAVSKDALLSRKKARRKAKKQVIARQRRKLRKR